MPPFTSTYPFLLSFVVSMAVVEAVPKVVVEHVALDSFIDDRAPSDWMEAFFMALGTTKDGDAEIFAEIPEDVVEDVVKTLTKKDNEDNVVKATPVVMGALKLFSRKVRTAMRQHTAPDQGAEQSAPVSATGAATAHTESRPKRRIADVLDQMDDGQFDPLTDQERIEYHMNYKMVTGGVPADNAEASPDQIAALKTKVDTGAAPYADFAVFVPHGVRFAKLRKFDAQVFVNNSLQQRVLRGPSNLASWLDSWRVFRTAMLSIKAAAPQTLDDYANGIQMLCNIHPSADDWGLIYAADEVMRHEIWNKIRDEMVLDKEWPEVTPWDAVIKKSCYGSGDPKRMHWWFLHVLAPAQRGGKNLVKAVEGTSLIPAPDGLFGNTASSSRGPAALTMGPGAGAAGGKGSARPSRNQRRTKANKGANTQGYGKGSANGNYESDGGKGKSKGHSKGKDHYGGKGKKGHKNNTK